MTINKLGPCRETVDFVEKSGARRVVHALDTNRRRGIEVQRFAACHRVRVNQRMQNGRRLAFRLRRDHPVDPLIAGQPLYIAENPMPALDQSLEPVGQPGVGGGQIHP